MTGKDIDYIKCQYREAADKKAIVGILADQYECYKSDMTDLLIYLGFEIAPIKRQNNCKKFFSDAENDIIYSGIVRRLKNREILEELKDNGFKRSMSGLSLKRQNMCKQYPELAQYRTVHDKWSKKELAWIKEHYGEDTNPQLAVKFKKEMHSDRDLQAITARIYSYAKTEHLQKG